jgi:hypothetical protein
MAGDKVIELLRKLNELAKRGVGGEKQNAETMLRKLMAKHNLTMEELEADELERHYFKVNKIESQILLQCLKCVNYDRSLYVIPSYRSKTLPGNPNRFIQVTRAEFVEIDLMFGEYSKAYKKDYNQWFTAWLMGNDLLAKPPADKQRKLSDLSPKEREEYMAAQRLAEAIEPTVIRKRLEK